MKQPAKLMAPASAPLVDAIKFVKQRRKDPDGCICPCCGSHRIVKRYRLAEQTARTLCRLYNMQLATGLPVHRRKWCPLTSQGHHSAILSFYRLIRQVTKDPSKPFNRSGEWLVTKLGERFIKELPADVRSYVIVDDRKRIGQSSKVVTLPEVLLEHWNPQDAYAPLPKQPKKAKP